MNRRRALSTLAKVAIGAGVAAAAGGGYYAWLTSRPIPPGERTGTLRVLEWTGYDVEDLWKPFKQKFPKVQVEFSFAVDDAEMLSKLRAGFAADIVHPCSYLTKRFVDAGVVVPIDASLIPEWDNLQRAFRENPDIYVDGKLYQVPVDWGFVSITYRPDLVEGQPDSWELLWDERYRGKLSMWDSALDSVPLAGQLLGFEDIWDMTDEQLQRAKQKLLQQKPLIRFYWTSSSDIYGPLASGEVVAAQTWQDAAAFLTSENTPNVYMNPKEGIWGWLCGLAIVKGTKNRDLAHEYINAWASASSGAWLIDNYWFGHTNRDSPGSADQQTVRNLGLDKPETVERTIFIRHMPRLELYQQTWNEVKAT